MRLIRTREWVRRVLALHAMGFHLVHLWMAATSTAARPHREQLQPRGAS
jgi:hypothetical protein